MNPELPLRDIHLPPAPGWWPPAPGWWVLALLVLLAMGFGVRALWRRRKARRRQRALFAQFEAAAALADGQERVIAISELLRRAARAHEPDSAQLQGEAWLRFLDRYARATPGMGQQAFSAGPGRVLLDGPYRPALDPMLAQALVAPARAGFRALVAPP